MLGNKSSVVSLMHQAICETIFVQYYRFSKLCVIESIMFLLELQLYLRVVKYWMNGAN
jgi:hypothetical protein